jgi:hypothetical protein
MYQPLLDTLRGNNGGFTRLEAITADLQAQGAVGLLEALTREARLVQRSGIFAHEIGPVTTLLGDAVSKTREAR